MARTPRATRRRPVSEKRKENSSIKMRSSPIECAELGRSPSVGVSAEPLAIDLRHRRQARNTNSASHAGTAMLCPANSTETSMPEITPDAEDWRARLKRDGYAYFPKLCPQALVMAARAAIDRDLAANFDPARQI